MDGFIPKAKYPIDHYIKKLEELRAAEARVQEENRKTYQAFQDKKAVKKLNAAERNAVYKKIAKQKEELRRINAAKERVREELRVRMNDTDVNPFIDDITQGYNECVGVCYGKCIYVDNEGDLRYREASEEDADEIGDTIDGVGELELFSTLPLPEKLMIINYIYENPKTPEWVKKRLEGEL